MKIWEIIKKENKNREYLDNRGNKWKINSWLNLVKEDENKEATIIEDVYSLSERLDLEFEEVVDWSKVKEDTPIWVKYFGSEWFPRHFAKYENGEVYVWADGYTSHTGKKIAGGWTEVKLHK